MFLGLTHFPKTYYGEDSYVVETNPYPWHSYLLSKLTEDWDARKIYWVWDPNGSTGKTYFQKYLFWSRQKDVLILPIASVKDVTYLPSQNPNASIILCNFTPTFCRADALGEIYSAIETIKDGLFSAVKYKSRMVSTTPPHIMIFSNFLPSITSMSEDGWEILRVTKEDRGYVELQEGEWRELSEDYEDYISHLYYYQENPQGYIKNFVEMSIARDDVLYGRSWDISSFYRLFQWTENMETTKLR